MKAEYTGYTGAYPKKKKKSVADQFAVEHRSESYTQTLNGKITGQTSTG